METFNYTISLKKNLNEDERKTLVNLYQPILGAQVSSIYFTLIEEKEILTKLTNLVFNEKRLMKLLKLSNSKLMEGIYKLEGLKLLKRSFKKSKNMVNFQIQPPLDPNAFFDNLLLNEMLTSALGDEDYEVTRYLYLDEELVDDEAEDLTVSFIDAFPEATNEMTLKNLVEQSPKPINENLIDFSHLELELIKHDLPTTILTKSVKKILLDNVHFLNLEQDTLVEIFSKVYNPLMQSVDKNLLKLALKNTWSQQLQSEKVHHLDQMKKEFKQMEPADYLESLTGEKTNPIFKELIKTLISKYHLAKENINCLLNYSVLKNNGKIISRYILKIADTLNKKQIVELDDVMNHLKTAHLYTTNKNDELVDEVQEMNDEQRFAHLNQEIGNEEMVVVELPEPNKYFMM